MDWFITADKLKQSGIVVLDDLRMSSVSVLADFQRPCWLTRLLIKVDFSAFFLPRVLAVLLAGSSCVMYALGSNALIGDGLP